MTKQATKYDRILIQKYETALAQRNYTAAQNAANELLLRNSEARDYAILTFDMPIPAEPTCIDEDRSASWDDWDLEDYRAELENRYIPAELVRGIKHSRQNHNRSTATK